MKENNCHTDLSAKISGSESSSKTNIATWSHIDAIATKNIDSGVDTSTEHTKPFILKHPVEDVTDLYGSEYGQYILRKNQLEGGVAPDDRPTEVEHRVELEFDTRVIEITKRVLELPVTDATRGEFPIKDSAVLTLVLHCVRNTTVDQFTAHLQELADIREMLSLPGDIDEDMLDEWEHALTEKDSKAIDSCATRVLYAVYRSGQPFPRTVWTAAIATPESRLLTATDKERIKNGQIELDVAREAVANWAHKFLTEVIQNEFSLGRDHSKTSFTTMSIIGVFANAALQSRTINEASKTCPRWARNRDLAPARNTITAPIGEMSIDEISELFRKLHHRFLELADEYTVFHESRKFAYDTTDILCFSGNEDGRWLKGYAETLKGNVSESDAEQKLELGLVATTESDLRLALGLYPTKKEYDDDEQDRQSVRSSDVVSRLMRPTLLNTPVSADLITMDAELSGADMVKRCRELFGESWVIRGKVEYELKKLVEETSENESRFVKLEDYLNDLSCKPNAIIVPTPHGASTDKSQWVFLTDLPREEFVTTTVDGEEVLGTQRIISEYQDRCRIEKTFQQVKNGFHIPVRDDARAPVKYFYFQISILFYNFHNLIINSISPQYGLPLGKTKAVSSGQVLQEVRDVAFRLAAEQED